MHNKPQNPLRKQDGMAMILVLCLGALFVALAAALVYAASLMMANADRQLLEQRVYEQAVSFSDVLEQELLGYTGGEGADTTSLGYFLDTTYLKGRTYDADYDHTFTYTPQDGEPLTITLRKTAAEADLTPYQINSSTDMEVLWQQLENWEKASKVNGFEDYYLTVTVTAKQGDAEFAYTRSYTHYGLYSTYYTIGDSKTAYQLAPNGNANASSGQIALTEAITGSRKTISNAEPQQIVPQFDANVSNGCRFTVLREATRGGAAE